MGVSMGLRPLISIAKEGKGKNWKADFLLFHMDYGQIFYSYPINRDFHELLSQGL